MSEQDVFEKLVIVLPSYEPDHKFLKVVEDLIRNGFKRIVIIDDGSGKEYQSLFEKADEFSQTYLIHHDGNKGKGRALKTAFEYVQTNFSDAEGVITIDGDGQHLTKDIIACGEKMLELKNTVVLGSRCFNDPSVPPRSVAGNKSTARLFKLFFNIQINDTQTGLRAIPAEFLGKFCQIEGERFEYETNMLLYLKRWNIAFYEQPITTVYDSEAYSSHYHALKDSLRISKIMIKYLLKRK